MNHLSKYLFQLIMCVSQGVHAQHKVPDIQWKSAAQLPAMSSTSYARGVAGGAAGITDDLFIFAGGANFPGEMPWNGGKKKYYDDIWLFSRSGNSLVPVLKKFSLPYAMAYGASCTTPYGLVILGGETENGLIEKALMVKYVGDSIDIDTLPSLPFAVANGTALCEGHFIYYAGGETTSGVSAALLRLDLKNINEGWKELSPLPHPVSHFVLTIQHTQKGKRLFAMGGRKKNNGIPSDFYAESFQYNIDSDRWSRISSIPVPLAAGTSAAVGKRWIFLFGGDEGKTFRKTEQLIFSIADQKDPFVAKALVSEKATLQSNHPGFSNQVWAYDTYEDKWHRAGYISFPVPVTTVAVSWDDYVFIPSGEIKAGVRSPEIISARIINKKNQTSYK